MHVIKFACSKKARSPSTVCVKGSEFTKRVKGFLFITMTLLIFFIAISLAVIAVSAYKIWRIADAAWNYLRFKKSQSLLVGNAWYCKYFREILQSPYKLNCITEVHSESPLLEKEKDLFDGEAQQQ